MSARSQSSHNTVISCLLSRPVFTKVSLVLNVSRMDSNTFTCFLLLHKGIALLYHRKEAVTTNFVINNFVILASYVLLF